VGEPVRASRNLAGRVAPNREVRNWSDSSLPYLCWYRWSGRTSATSTAARLPAVAGLGTDVTLQTYVTDRCGYQLVGITSGSIEMTYKTVPTPTEPADRPACTADTMSVSLRRT